MHKEKVYNLTSVLRRITKYSEVVELVAMSIEEPLVQKVEKYYSKGKVMYEFMDKI